MSERCRLCSGSARSLLDERSYRRYHWCESCDLIVLDREHMVTMEQERARYLLHDNSSSNAGYAEFLGAFVKDAIVPASQKVSESAEGPLRALDYGAGPEPVLATLVSGSGVTCEIYDPFFHPAADVVDSSYDLVLVHEVIEHVSDPSALFARLAGLVRIEGELVIRTRFHPAGDDAFLGWWYRMDETHVAFYSETTFTAIENDFPFALEWTNGKDMCRLTRKG